MYVRLIDDLKRAEGGNPTLGTSLCTDKDDTLVCYSALQESQQLFASKYRLILPSEDELRDEVESRHILELPEKSTVGESSPPFEIRHLPSTCTLFAIA
jgi:hypothetical protein